MRKSWFTLALFLGVSCLGFLLPARAAADDAAQESQIAEGERLVHVLDCNVCHTPKMMTDQGPVPDPDRLLMGHPSDEALVYPAAADGWFGSFNGHFTAWSGPWGISYAINLTPDMDTGIGSWSLEMFSNAIRSGKHMGEGRPILPPMPWPAYARLTDEELAAIFSYLQSVKPIANAVPEPAMPASGE